MKYHMTFKNKNKKKKGKEKRGVLVSLPKKKKKEEYWSDIRICLFLIIFNDIRICLELAYQCSFIQLPFCLLPFFSSTNIVVLLRLLFKKKIIIIYNICWYAQHYILYFVDYSCILVCLSIKSTTHIHHKKAQTVESEISHFISRSLWK